MRKQIRCVILTMLVGSTSCFALDNYLVGARSLGLSHSFVSFSDTWSTFHNQAGLAGISNITSGFYYESKFNIDELSLTAGSLIIPVEAGSFGASFYQFGKGSFKEHKIGIAFAKQLGNNLSAGIQMDYFSQRFPENERANGFVTLEGGIIWTPLERFSLGSHIFNPVSGGIESASGKQKMPVILRAGGHYRFDKTVLATFEFQKNSNAPMLLKTGIEFCPFENLALRFGVSGKSLKYTAGIGYKAGKINTDIGFGYHGNLGITPSISIQFQL